MQINSVEKRSGDPGHISFRTVPAQPALVSGFQRISALAGIHCCHKLDTGRIDDTMIGPDYGNFSRLQRLPQGIEHLRGKLRQFIQEKNPMMSQ